MGPTQCLTAVLLLLLVIPDMLSATMKPQALIRDQGDSLELICEASTATAQHTHLSVTWYLLQEQGDGQAQRILSVSRDFVLLPGSSYNQRFSSGDIRLDKIGGKQYKLSIVNIQPSDQGEVYCEAVEWIQDPDETWKDIARKQTEKTSLTIRSLESHLQLFVGVNKEKIMEGETLVFHCNVSLAANSLSVNWWHIQKARDPPVLLASMDQDGRLKIGTSYLERSAHGELKLEKMDHSAFILTIYNTLAAKDTGLYRCEMTAWSKGRNWRNTQEISTEVEPLGLNLKAVLSSRVPNVKLHEEFELFCKVSTNDVTNNVPISITWQFQPSIKLGGGYQRVVKVTAGGAIEWGLGFMQFQKKTKISKLSSFSQLIIHSATWQDAGLYRCEAEIWRNAWQARNLSMVAAAMVFSNPVEIKVTKPEIKLRVNMDAKFLEISSKEDIEIDCRILSLTNEDSQLGVTWYFVPFSPVDAVPLLIIKTNYSNVLEYGEAFSSPHQKSRFHSEKVSKYLYQLLILSGDYDAHGKYYCIVDEWIWSTDGGWYKLGKMESGKTTVHFTLSENKPFIERTNYSITVTENEDVILNCTLQNPIQPTSHFSISWFKVSEYSSTETLVKMKNNGILEYGDGKMTRRLQPHCPSVGDFRLVLQNAEMADAGLFYCQVEELQAINCNATRVQHALGQSGYSQLVVLPSASTNSSQICSSPSLFHFILFYPLVLFLILMAIFLFLHFKKKHVQKKKLNLGESKTSGEELEVVAPAHFKFSDKSSSNAAEEVIHRLKANEED
ncbi:immunoglobulin superfamily member 2-like isoform X2 [Rhineura floridana]|uniref:immunoglobulin superfamily member 2-like isoform X2 n=1 Tax=Rhineura floridana TaxID=261503 RepID=UPI002AC8305E|nr:immunoglobulin superfamily member 2-like isoform X2 [Rhineura floridana]